MSSPAVQPAPTLAAPPRGLSDKSVRNLCLFPVLGLLIAFNVFPLLASLAISFTDYATAGPPRPVQFVGLENYRQLINQPPQQEPWKAFQRTAAVVIVCVTLQTLIGFGVALLLRRNFAGRGLITALLLIPMTLSPAIVAGFWRYMFNPQWGLVNFLLATQQRWDGFGTSSFWAVVIVEVWMWTPFMMLLSLAALNSIPPALYEAAEVDRASAWFRFRHITLPLAMPLVLLGVVFRVMDTFRIFDTAAVLNETIEQRPTTFISILLYIRGIKNSSSSLGEGTALAYLLLIVAMALGNLAVWYLDRMRSRHG